MHDIEKENNEDTDMLTSEDGSDEVELNEALEK